MKPLQFNLRDAKKVSGDKSSSTFQVKGGHQIRVAHAALKPEHRQMIEKLPVVKMADGGTIPAEPNASVNTDAPDMTATSEAAPPQAAPAPVRAPASVTPGAAADPLTDTTIGKEFTSGYNQAQRGIREKQAVQTAESQEVAPILANDIQERYQTAQNIQDAAGQLHHEHDQFLKDAAAGHINPNHFLQNQSTGQKISTAIGLFLGGLSTPYTHQGNPALQFLNQQIDRDIQAQKDNLGQTNTIYNANRQYFGDTLMAENATRAQLYGVTQVKLQEEANKIGTPTAKANADLAIADLKMKQGQLIDQNAVRAGVMKQLKQGGAGVDPLVLGKAGFIAPEEAQKEQVSIDSQRKAVQAAQSWFDHISKEQTAGNLLNPQSYARAKALRADLVNAIMNVSPSKRLTHESVEAEIAPLDINTRDSSETAKTKFDQVLNAIGRHADPTPYTSKLAPSAVPRYPFQNSPNAGRTGVDKTTGQRVRIDDSGRPVAIK